MNSPPFTLTLSSPGPRPGRIEGRRFPHCPVIREKLRITPARSRAPSLRYLPARRRTGRRDRRCPPRRSRAAGTGAIASTMLRRISPCFSAFLRNTVPTTARPGEALVGGLVPDQFDTGDQADAADFADQVAAPELAQPGLEAVLHAADMGADIGLAIDFLGLDPRPKRPRDGRNRCSRGRRCRSARSLRPWRPQIFSFTSRAEIGR